LEHSDKLTIADEGSPFEKTQPVKLNLFVNVPDPPKMSMSAMLPEKMHESTFIPVPFAAAIRTPAIELL
jgi:hypothetical protein